MPNQNNKNSGTVFLYIILVSLIVLNLGLIAWYVYNSDRVEEIQFAERCYFPDDEKLNEIRKDFVEKKGEVKRRKKKKSVSKNEKTNRKNIVSVDNSDVPIKFIANNKSTGLTLNIHESKFSPYAKSYSYSFKGYLSVDGYEIQALSVDVKLLDENDELLELIKHKVINRYLFSVRSGDEAAVYFSKYIKKVMPKISRIEIEVSQVTKTKAASNYESSKPIELHWIADKPTNMDISVKERINSIVKFTNSCSNKITWEFTNTGKLLIEQLKVRIEWFNKANDIIETKDFYITISSYSPIIIDQTRIYGGTWNLKTPLNNYSHYKMSVIEIK